MVYSWKFLSANIADGKWIDDNEVIVRTDIVQKLYNVHLDIIESKYATRDDYIKVTCLKWRPFKDASGKIIAVKQAGSLAFAIEANLFPYNIRKGLRHYVFWAESPLNSASADSILSTHFENKRLLWFVNAPKHKSIHGVWHAQVFVK